MSIPLNDDLPDVLKTVRTKPMFVMRAGRPAPCGSLARRRVPTAASAWFPEVRLQESGLKSRLAILAQSGTRHYFQARWHNHWARKNLNLQKFKI